MWDCTKLRWKHRLEMKVDKIMATLEELAGVLDGIAPKVAAVKTDVETLLAKLTTIPTGGLTPEQQAIIDDAVAKATAISDSLGAIDAEVPKGTVPPAP